MTRFSSLALLLAAPLSILSAQSPDWVRTYGGPEGERGDAIIATSDGGFLVGGYTSSFPKGKAQIYLVKTDAAGEAQWEKSLATGPYAELLTMFETSPGMYMLIARAQDDGQSWRVFTGLADRAGNIVSSRYLGSAGDYALQAVRTRDGGAIVGGSFGTDAVMLRITPAGELAWRRSFDLGRFEAGYGIGELADGAFVLTGLTDAPPSVNRDVFLIKASANGDSVWSRTVGTSKHEHGTAVIEAKDGGLLVAGVSYTDPNNARARIYLLKVDSAGIFESSSFFTDETENKINRLERTRDGHILALGTFAPAVYSQTQAFIGKFDDAWRLRWQIRYSENGESMSATAALELSNGGYMVTGSTGRNMFLMKIGAEPPAAAPSEYSLPSHLDLR